MYVDVSLSVYIWPHVCELRSMNLLSPNELCGHPCEMLLSILEKYTEAAPVTSEKGPMPYYP